MFTQFFYFKNSVKSYVIGKIYEIANQLLIYSKIEFVIII